MRIGVDFGTCFSSAAVYIDGQVKSITFGSDRQFRTAVFFPNRYVDFSKFVLTAADEREVDNAIRTYTSRFNLQLRQYQDDLSEQIREEKRRAKDAAPYSPEEKATRRQLLINPKRLSDDDVRQLTIKSIRSRWGSQQQESIAQEGLDVRQSQGVFGEEAIEALYNGEDGRIFQSPKSMLGQRLEPRHRDVVVGAIGQVLAHIRTSASRQLGSEVCAVVLGRPVEFRGMVGTSNDQEAQSLLERAAREAGFREIEFLHEPAAAAFGYHRKSSQSHTALIIDIGGGTTDIAYAQVGGDAPLPIIYEVWGKGFGGTDIDVELSVSAAMPLFGKDHPHGLPLHAYRSAAQISELDLQSKFINQDVARVVEPFKTRLQRLKAKGTTIRLNRDIEQMKIDLSADSNASAALDYIEPELHVAADSCLLEKSAKSFIANFRSLLERVRNELPESQPTILMAGGMSQAPYVLACVREVFGQSTIEMGDALLGVVNGLALFAGTLSAVAGEHLHDGAFQAMATESLPPRQMHRGANDGLTEQEILRRDLRTDAACASIRALEQRFSLNLYSWQREKSLIPGIPDYMHISGKRVYGEAWLDKRLDYIESQVVAVLAKEVLKGVGSRPRNDRELSGSAWAIAQRLSLYRYSLPPYDSDSRKFDCDMSGLRISLQDVMCDVHDRLVKDHMTYRLWDDEALDQLDHYLHYEVCESELFIEGALHTGVYGRPATLTEFLNGVDEAIANLPEVDLYECRFPDDYPEQVLFSEYVSAQQMTEEQKSWLYHKYLEVYARENGIDIPLTDLDRADVRVLLEAVEQAQAVQLRWFVPEGIPAEEAMDELLSALDNQTLVKAQRRMRRVLDQLN